MAVNEIFIILNSIVNGAAGTKIWKGITLLLFYYFKRDDKVNTETKRSHQVGF